MIVTKKSELDCPEHEILRIDVAGVSHWDMSQTKIWIEATCWTGAEKTHTVVNTVNGYIDVPISLAHCKDGAQVLKLALTDKLINKPTQGIRLVIHDFIAYGLLTGQHQPHNTNVRKWVRETWATARKTGVPVTIELGEPWRKTEIRQYADAGVQNSEKIIPSDEMLGTATRRFIKEQKKARF